MAAERIIAYIDGYNLYYGLREKGWKWAYWLDVQAMAKALLKPGQALVLTKYFTSVVKRPEDRRRRQAIYLEALQTLTEFEIYYGHFLADTITCRACGATHETYHEKMTDVNIAVQMISDAYRDQFDTALLVSADSDLVSPVTAVRQLFADKRVVVALPPARWSKALSQAANGYLHIGPNTLSKCLFPDQLRKPDGFVLQRPAEWR